MRLPLLAAVSSRLISFFCNTAPITIPPAPGAASVYPCQITEAGLTGTTLSVVMDISGLIFPGINDVNLFLVSPTGQKFVPFAFVSDATAATTNATIRLDDLAAIALPGTGPVTSGSNRRSHGLNGAVVSPVTFVAPAPAPPYGSPAAAGVEYLRGCEPKRCLCQSEGRPGDPAGTCPPVIGRSGGAA